MTSDEFWRNTLTVIAGVTLPGLISFVWASLHKKKEEDPDAPRPRKRSPAKE